jgi:hypothetical protein
MPQGKEKAVQAGHAPAPSGIVASLLAAHPEAASLLAEASHRQALAERSAAAADQAFAAAQAARLSAEELRRRLDPRYSRPVHFAAGMAILAAFGLGLAMLNGIELAGALGERTIVPATVTTTALWLTGAWLVVLAKRDGRRAVSASLISAAVVLVLFLAVLHGLGTFSRRSAGWDHCGQGALLGLLIGFLAASAAVLIARMEPASVLLARRRWHQARAHHATADRLEHADSEAAAVAREAWLNLVRTHASTVGAEGGDCVVPDSVMLASALQELGRSRIGPAPATS